MASSFIKGISVQISGDTTGLQKSLSEVNKSLKNTQFELNSVNKLLKLDPKNTELLAQKQSLLAKSITETEDKLKALKRTKEEFDSKGSKTEEQEKQYRELTREIASTEQALKKLNSEFNNGASSVEKNKESLLNFGDVLKANVLSDAIVSGVKALGDGLKKLASSYVDVLKSGVEYNAQMESYQTAFAAMIGSTEEAEKALEDIKKNASKSPFDLSSLIQANQLLLTTGETAEDTAKVINALGDAVAYTGGGNDELTRMAQNLQQIKNVGKASSTDIKQFAMAGINVYGILSDYLGVNIDQVKELDISYEDLSNALIQASEDGGQYYGAMESQAETFNGQVTQLKSNWDEFTGLIANDTTSALTDSLLPAFNDVITQMQEGFSNSGVQGMLDAITEGVGTIGDILVEDFGVPEGLVEAITTICDTLTSEEMVQFFDDVFVIVDDLADIIANLVELESKLGLVKLVLQGIHTWLTMIKAVWEGLKDLFDGNGTLWTEGIKVYQSADGTRRGYSKPMSSGGFASGGFASGGITLNASFNMASTQLNETSARQLADIMADEINNKLGGLM